MNTSEQASGEKLQEQAPRFQPSATRSWRACESCHARVSSQLLIGRHHQSAAEPAQLARGRKRCLLAQVECRQILHSLRCIRVPKGFIQFTFPCSMSRQSPLLQQARLKPHSSKERKHMVVATQRMCEG